MPLSGPKDSPTCNGQKLLPLKGEWSFTDSQFNALKDEFRESLGPTWATLIQRGASYQPALYALLRLVGADSVVETGVHCGISTRAILTALDRNWQELKRATLDLLTDKREDEDTFPLPSLYSVDPRYQNQAAAEAALIAAQGFPPGLFAFWRFHGGKSREGLVDALLPSQVDVFVHDSDHGYDNMVFELQRGWDMISDGGFIVIDDAVGLYDPEQGYHPPHDATLEFLQKVNRQWLPLDGAIAIQK